MPIDIVLQCLGVIWAFEMPDYMRPEGIPGPLACSGSRSRGFG